MIRIADNVITGADKRLMLYFYYSPVSGKNIVRRFTSLTGERVRKDAAFKGFRESGNRMKEASPIAAALYKLVPAEIKQYSLYRLLTGEAIKMLKQGLDAANITKTLKQIYIDPLLQEPEKKRMSIKRTRTGNRDKPPGGLANISKYCPINSLRKNRIRRWRSRHTERPIINLPAFVGNLQRTGMDLSEKETSLTAQHSVSTQGLQISVINNTQSESHQQTPTPTTKYPELMYRGRLRECKKLRLYIRSSHFPGMVN